MPNPLTPARRRACDGHDLASRAHGDPKPVPRNCWIRSVDIQALRNEPLAHHQCGLDNACDARDELGVTDVRLDGSNEQRLGAIFSERSRQSGYLNAVASARSGAMRFDIGDLARIDAGVDGRAAHKLGLSTRLGVPIEPLDPPSLLTAEPRITA